MKSETENASFGSGSEQEDTILEERSLESEDEHLESDNLIPVPPARPLRTRKVRLKNRGKDVPQPAEDPRAPEQ